MDPRTKYIGKSYICLKDRFQPENIGRIVDIIGFDTSNSNMLQITPIKLSSTSTLVGISSASIESNDYIELTEATRVLYAK